MNDRIELEVQIHRHTELAALVSVDGNAKAARWLPKIWITGVDWKDPPAGPITIRLSQRHAEAKGLV